MKRHINLKTAMTALAGLLMFGGTATAQDAASQGSGKIADFNSCIETNASVLIQQADLIRLCLDTHSRAMNRELIRSQGSYRQTDNGLIFLLRMQNTSPDSIVTSYSVILKHAKAESPQVFNLAPVSILPGGVVDVPLGGLTYVPDAADLGNDQFQFGVDGVRGVTLELR